MSVVLPFEDVNTFDGGYSYYTPNEDFKIWRSLLRDIPIHRAAAICSAGEVGLFGLLSHVRRDLVLVDHSYGSMGVALLKYAALREYGWEKTVAAFRKHNSDEWKALFDPLIEQLPENIRAKLRADNFRGYGSYIAREWDRVPTWVRRKACRKLDRVSFLHGDLSDLIERGPFDILYASNAFGHNNREGKRPEIEQVKAALKPGGYLICASYTAPEQDGLILVKTARGGYSWETPNCISWTYFLYRTPKEGENVS